MALGNKATAFYLIHESEGELDYKTVTVSQPLQQELSGLLSEQASEFLEYEQAIEFDGGYKPSRDEILVIRNFELPAKIQEIANLAYNPPALGTKELGQLRIKAFFALIPGKKSHEMYFQSITKSQVILPDKWNFRLSNDTLEQLREPGLTLGQSLSAVHDGKDLFFRSFTLAKRFLDLSGYFREATDKDVEEFRNDFPVSLPEDSILEDLLDSWSRSKIYSLKQGEVFTALSASQIGKIAKKYDVPVSVTKVSGQMVLSFPKEKKDFKRVLRFLDEDILDSPLTGRTFLSNSKRTYQGN